MEYGLRIDEAVEWLRGEFLQHADGERAVSMAAYMKNHFPFHGLPKPVRAEIQRPWVKEWKSADIDGIHGLVQRLWEMPEREYQYVAMDILLVARKKWNKQTLEVVETLITEKSWWDTVDMLASRMVGGYCQQDPDKHRRRLVRYAESDNLWLNRTALIHQLFYRDLTDTELFEEIYEHCGHKTFFFIQKAIGWALRQYSATDPDFVMDFVERRGVQGLAKREALRKIAR